MEYYLIMDGSFSQSSRVTKLNADNMVDAKKEGLVHSLCDRYIWEIPKKIDYKEFNKWLTVWLGKEFIDKECNKAKRSYVGLKKEYKTPHGFKKVVNEAFLLLDVRDYERCHILEVNSNEGLHPVCDDVVKFWQDFIFNRTSTMIEQEEREQLEELKKKYEKV